MGEGHYVATNLATSRAGLLATYLVLNNRAQLFCNQMGVARSHIGNKHNGDFDGAGALL
jgi:hypothetical protein